jgi:hypothetical protein
MTFVPATCTGGDLFEQCDQHDTHRATTYTGSGVWSANRTARGVTRAISEIHIMAAPTDRRGGGVCRICSDIVLSVASRNFTLRSAWSLRQTALMVNGTIFNNAIGEMEIRIDPPQKRTPGSRSSRGLVSCCLVGSCDPGGFGVSGDGGAAGIGPTAIPLIANFTLQK